MPTKLLIYFYRKLRKEGDDFEKSTFCQDFFETWESFTETEGQYQNFLCLGLGNFAQSPNSSSQVSAKFQLLLLKAFASKRFKTVQVFDPILTSSEKNILRRLNIEPLNSNQEGHYCFEQSKTVFFLPHCPKQLLNNLIWSNWSNLDFVLIIGNSIRNLVLNLSKKQLESVEYVKILSKYTSGKTIYNLTSFAQLAGACA